MTLRDVLLACAEASSTEAAFITGQRKDRRISLVRLMYYHLARQYTQASWPEIARYCGGRDHTTALAGAERFAGRLLQQDHEAFRLWVQARCILGDEVAA